MIPSLVVTEIRSALIEYLATTFALSNDDVRDALRRFLTDQADGIFRGPYLFVRTPFEGVDEHWEQPLDWLPDGFRPFDHQAKAFDRLSSAGGRAPQPTIVTTGTGSGKTECFLYPILDHCARVRAEGESGVKALILYPMNALASDQAGRIAGLFAAEPRLAGITAGLYVGEAGSHSTMGADHLIDKREVLQVTPPDILLTNYKMLDFLLLRRADHELWAEANLQYLVLDEFHTYDGAQGTDVAMLLRRLGRTLKVAGASGPLGSVTPVATSATLGVGPMSTLELREFAEKVFGRGFPEESVIGETRQSIDAACGPVNYLLPIPDPAEIVKLGVEDVESVASAFCVPLDDDGAPEGVPPESLVELGDLLLVHPLTRAVLAAVGERSRSWSETVAEVVTRVPDWGRAAMRDERMVEQALAQYVWLLSLARRRHADRLVPLFAVEVQLWIREVSRVLRAVHVDPQFRWRDSAAPAKLDDTLPNSEHELPAVYCRRCGMSGWMAVASELGNTMLTKPNTIYQAALSRAATQRVLLRCSDHEPDAQHYDPSARQLLESAREATVPVLVTPSEDAAKRSQCPGCGEGDTIRFLGLQVASLASVSINTLFGSSNMESDERKLLAFTDSVQDASHRAAFFAGRTYRFNLRTLMAHAISDTAGISVAELGESLYLDAQTPEAWYGLVPPDLLRHPEVRTTWTDTPSARKEVLRQRVAFEVAMEFGFRARVGRTLELSTTAAAMVDVPEIDEIADLVAEDIEAQFGRLPIIESAGTDVYLRGLLERLRLRGGVLHRFLDPYILDGGRLWHIWGGRPDGLQPFPPGQSRPLFVTTAPKGDFDSVTALATTPTWMIDWAQRCLGLSAADARTVNHRAHALLAAESGALVEITAGQNRVYGLDPSFIRIDDVPLDSGFPMSSILRCEECGHRHAAPPDQVGDWYGTPCLRYRCPGRFVVAQPESANYYRRLYRQGVTRRVVTGEHTGLLKRREREALEAAFKSGSAPDSPNVITATPTLEMGIDIGDLSAVMLISVPPTPANYIQRVGRAGRQSGNALITTFARGDSHDLYYLAEPEAMIAGDIRPPNCYLDAAETLHRQYVAYLIDRIADHTLDAPPIPNQIVEVMNKGLDEGGLLRRLVDASTFEHEHAETFVSLFGSHISVETGDRLREFAAGGIEVFLKAAAERWRADFRELGLRRDRLNEAIRRIDDQPYRSGDDDHELTNLRGQRAAIVKLLGVARREYTLSALERLGILPNYTLIDDAATLQVTMWTRADDGEYSVDDYEYSRPAVRAVNEFAPGNSFYVAGHRHVVDALEVGTSDQPLTETWRLCAECGYGVVETEGDNLVSCPRCGGHGIADAGSRHTMLQLRTARAASSEEAARVYDETDEREREHYDVITTVDADPVHISGAWQLVDRAFGAELSRRTELRTINLGFSDRSGEKATIGGASRHVTRFTVCAHCGAARDARDDRDGSRPERLHQGWCKVRSGALAQRWESILLYHQLTTEAVRMLLPLSLFEVDERLASFKGALLLGLREDFGGDPDHLDVIRAELPNRSGQGRYRFLVLYDRVPGGTGYLARLADPDRVRSILDAGRTVIARCQCQGEGRPACHRCLLGVLDRHEYDLVSRELALELLDDLLEHWEPDTSIDTVASVDIAKVEESELERRFKVALQDWAARTDGITMLPVPGDGGHSAWELRIAEGDEFLRYRIGEQEGLSTTPSTQPDFLIRRVDDVGRDIAVYLDGYQFHASTEVNNLAADSEKRAGVRASNRLVWNLTWADVTAFHEAVLSDLPREPPHRPLLSGSALLRAKQIHQARDGVLDFDTVGRNPVALLLWYLRHPHAVDWHGLALSAVGGFAAAVDGGVHPVTAETLRSTVSAMALGREPVWSTTESPAAFGVASTTLHDLPLGVLLDGANPDLERWTAFAVIADDATALASDSHRERWRDWLQWANVLQFLGPIDSEQTAWISAASMGSASGLDDLFILSTAVGDDEPELAPPVALPRDIAAELDMILDDAVRELVAQVAADGAGWFEAGSEHDGVPIEAAWPSVQVGVMPAGDDRTIPGWDVRPVDKWTVADLLARVQE